VGLAGAQSLIGAGCNTCSTSNTGPWLAAAAVHRWCYRSRADHTHIHTHTRTHARARARTHARTHAPTHAHTHACTHARTCTPHSPHVTQVQLISADLGHLLKQNGQAFWHTVLNDLSFHTCIDFYLRLEVGNACGSAQELQPAT